MLKNVIVIDKKIGQTPLSCIETLKNEHPEWKHTPLTYAGRLDPLASGVLLVLVGDECLKKDEYLALPKEYEVTVLFGFATDTYDVMGKVIEESTSSGKPLERSSDLLAQNSDKVRGQTIPKSFPDSVLDALKNFTGRFTQAYPPYSSRTVDGKPLFQWAREGKLNEIVIPSHDVYVESIGIIENGSISGGELETNIKEMIAQVSSDFRQEEILDIWHKILENSKEKEFPTITLRIVCGSGVYVRSIAHELGIALGIPALALSIVRTKVGEYKIESIS